MFFRGHIQRPGHGRCNLHPKPAASSNGAELSASSSIAPTETILQTFCRRIVIHPRRTQKVSDGDHRHPFHMPRVRFPGTPAGVSRVTCCNQPCVVGLVLNCLSRRIWRQRNPTPASRSARPGWLCIQPRPSRRINKGLVRFARGEVTYVRSVLGNRVRALGNGGDLTHLHRHHLLQFERLAQGSERHGRGAGGGRHASLCRYSAGCLNTSDRPGRDSLFRKRRCPMVEIIGFGTMAALVWLLAWSLAGESESEKRRMSSSHEGDHSVGTVAQGTRTRHAA